jgi:hypothetical protein
MRRIDPSRSTHTGTIRLVWASYIDHRKRQYAPHPEGILDGAH